MQVITVSGTYVPSSGTRAILFECVGGGGGGGNANNFSSGQSSAGGGGGGGSYSRGFTDNPEGSYAIQIGAGGFPDQAPFTTMVTGALSYLRCEGGRTGSTSYGTVGGQQITLGGAGGNESLGGFLNTAGQPGGAGITLTTSIAIGGSGGSSYFGSGAQGNTSEGNGAAAVNYGAGGAGAVSTSGSYRQGGRGSPGVVVVWEFK